MKKINNNRISEILFPTVTLFIVIAIMLIVGAGAFVTPYRSGDGEEYMLMTEAFERHFSPDVTQEDIEQAGEDYNYSAFEDLEIEKAKGFFKAENGKYYSYHFWLYSLLAMPFKALIKAVGGNQLGAFYLLNSASFIVMLFISYIWLYAKPDRKLAWVVLVSLNPVLFYLTWTHTEMFSYCMVCISLVMFQRKGYKRAIFFACVSAMQNQPTVFLAGMYFIDYIFEFFTDKEQDNRKKFRITKQKLKKFAVQALISVICFVPFFVPFMFYQANFGVPSLILETSNSGISFEKILSMFFDLNFGMVLYMPVLILLFVSFVIIMVFIRPRRTIMYTVTLLLMCMICSMQSNWNPDTAGMNRYAIWITPLMISFCVLETEYFDETSMKSLFLAVYAMSAGWTFFSVCSNGLLVCSQSYKEFTPTAISVMKNRPELYNPVQEIFYERFMGEEKKMDGDPMPKIIYNNDSIVKIFMNNSQKELMEKIIDKDYIDVFENRLETDKDGWYYLNFKKGELLCSDERYWDLQREKEILNNFEDFELDGKDMSFGVSDISLPQYFERDSENNEVSFIFKNTSDEVFPKVSNDNENNIGISYHIYDNDKNETDFHNERIYFNVSLLPGDEILIKLKVDVSELKKGKYILMLDCVQEGNSWFYGEKSPYAYAIEVK